MRMTTISGRRALAALCVLLLAAAAAILSIAHSSPAKAQQTPSPAPATVQAAAQGLASAPDVNLSDNSVYYRSGAEARAATAELARSIPLPSAGNFNGIHWEVIDNGGISQASLLSVLEANAACQWFRAYADNRQSVQARAIIPLISQWSAIRTNELAAGFTAAAADLAKGGGAALEGQIATCQGVGAREQAFAKSQGLTPPL